MTKLTKMQMSNLGALINLLIGIPDKDYNHKHYGVVAGDRDDTNPNAVCAMGHAVKNPDKFKMHLPESKRGFVQRLFGIKTTQPTKWCGYPRTFAEEVFGNELFYHAFCSDAYGMEPEHVTKNMVLDRLFKVKVAGAVPA